MKDPLFLTPKERLLVARLPAGLADGLVVEDETLAFRDTDAHRLLRWKTMDIKDDRLRALMKRAETAETEDELLAFAREIDLDVLPQGDAAEVAFLMGPDGLSLMIFDALTSAGSPADMDRIRLLCLLRHGLLLSLQPASRPNP